MRQEREEKRDAGRASYPSPASEVRLQETFDAVSKALAELPASDNTEGAVEKMLRANAILRQLPWPSPFDETTHRVCCADARDLSWLAEESIHLVVTSPPYWTLKDYEPRHAQLGAIADYELFLSELDRVWRDALGSWRPEAGFVVWSATCASPGNEGDGTTFCLCTRTFKLAAGGSDLTA